MRSEPGQVVGPRLDAHQQRVVDHPGGPMLVLAGPGTGKTTTLVEAIVDRIEQRGASPDEVLALTFSRKAAEQLRDRVTARLGRTSTTTLSSTFHSFAYGLIRSYTPAGVYDGPLRLLSAPRGRRGDARAADRPPRVGGLARVPGPGGRHPRVRPRGAGGARPGPRQRPRRPRRWSRWAAPRAPPSWSRPACSWVSTSTTSTPRVPLDYSDLIRRATAVARDHRDELRARFTHVFVDEYQDTDPGQVALLQEIAGDGRNLTVVGDPHQSIYGFRGAEVRGILEFPDHVPRRGRVAGRGAWRCAPPAASARDCCWPPDASPAASPCRAPSPRRRGPTSPTRWPSPARTATVGSRCSPSTPSGPRPSTWPTCCGVPTSRTASTGTTWRCWSAPAQSSIPGLRRSLGAAGVPVEVACDDVPLVRDPAVLPLLDGLRAIVNLDNDDPDHVDFLDPGRIESLLLGPLRGWTPAHLRRLVRLLRARRRPWPRPRTAHPDARATWCGRSPSTRASSTTSTDRRSTGARAFVALRCGAARLEQARRQRRGRPLAAVVGHDVARSAASRGSSQGGVGRSAGRTATSTRSSRSSR